MSFNRMCFKFCCGVALLGILGGCKDEKKNNNFAPVVGVTHVHKESVPLTIEAAGKVSGSLDIQIRAQVGGILCERKFKEGQYVKKGESLFLIDPVPYKTVLNRMEGALAQSQSDYKRAQRNFTRMKKLFANKAVSQKEYDDSQSDFESAEARLRISEANVKEAKINLEYTNVVAPISGIVRKENQNVGSLISTAGESSLLTSMVQMNPLHVNFAVAGEFWRKILGLVKTSEVNMPNLDSLVVQVVMPDGKVCPVSGKIVFVDSSEDAKTSTITMKAEIENENGKSGLLPGQFVKVKVIGANYQNPVVPNSCVIATANGNMVYVIDKNNVAQVRPVKVKLLGNKAIVMDGLKVGEVVVCDGIIKVRAGSKITPIFKDKNEEKKKDTKTI